MHKLTPYDPANALVDDEEIAVFMADALETGDSAYIAKALGVIARAKGMSTISCKRACHENNCIDHSVIRGTQRSKPRWRS